MPTLQLHVHSSRGEYIRLSLHIPCRGRWSAPSTQSCEKSVVLLRVLMLVKTGISPERSNSKNSLLMTSWKYQIKLNYSEYFNYLFIMESWIDNTIEITIVVHWKINLTFWVEYNLFLCLEEVNVNVKLSFRGWQSTFSPQFWKKRDN